MTVLGYHSVAELSDLVTAKDVAMRNLARHLAEVSDSEKLQLSTFLPAYNALTTRYGTARAKALQAVDNATKALRNPAMIIAEDEWKGLLTALNPRWEQNTWSPGDGSLDDLYARTAKAGAVGAYDEATPQPTPGTDVDFNALSTTTQITQAIESQFDMKHLILYGVIGGAFLIFVLPRLMALGMPGGMLLRR